MKTHSRFVLAAVAGLALTIQSAQATEARSGVKRSDAVRSTQAAPAQMSSGSDRNFGLGLATFYSVVNTPGLQTAALSAWFQLAEMSVLLAHLGIEDTSPFLFSTGGHFRQTVAGDRRTGFHLGGGLKLGTALKTATTNAFFISIQGLAGVHYTFSGLERVVFSADGGPSFDIVDGAFTFAMGGFSPLLGLSVHYLF